MVASIWSPTAGSNIIQPYKILQADATGSLDATDAFSAAIRSFDPAIGGTLIIPPGNFRLRPTAFASLANVNILGVGRYASNLLLTEAGYLMTLSACQWMTLKNCGIGLYGTPQSISNTYGVKLDNYSSNCEIESNTFYGFHKDALQLIGTSGQPLSGNKVKSNYFLGNGDNQLQGQYNNDYHVSKNQFGRLAGIARANYGVLFNQCSAGTYTENYHWQNGVGMLNLSGSYNTVSMNRYEESQNEGYVHNGGEYNIFSLNKLHTNSNVADGTKDAAYFQNSGYLSVLDNKVFSFDTRKHFWGINIDNGCSNLTVLGNQVSAYNATAGAIRVSGATTGFINTDDKVNANSITGIAANLTRFVGQAGFSATEVESVFVVPFRETPIKFYVATDVAPGVGTFVITLRKNGADTGMTCTVPTAGFAAVAWNLTPAVFFDPEDQFTFKVVTAVGAATARFRIYMIMSKF